LRVSNGRLFVQRDGVAHSNGDTGLIKLLLRGRVPRYLEVAPLGRAVFD
jgi:hypothetical protein